LTLSSDRVMNNFINKYQKNVIYIFFFNKNYKTLEIIILYNQSQFFFINFLLKFISKMFEYKFKKYIWNDIV